MRTDGQHRIQKQNALICPFLKISVVGNIAAKIVMQLLINVLKGRRNFFLAGQNRKTKPMEEMEEA